MPQPISDNMPAFGLVANCENDGESKCEATVSIGVPAKNAFAVELVGITSKNTAFHPGCKEIVWVMSVSAISPDAPANSRHTTMNTARQRGAERSRARDKKYE